MKLDEAKQLSLGLNPRTGITSGGAMRYAVGCIKRERERLARVFRHAGLEAVAREILDESLDDQVFRWAGPETDLDAQPKPCDH